MFIENAEMFFGFIAMSRRAVDTETSGAVLNFRNVIAIEGLGYAKYIAENVICLPHNVWKYRSSIDLGLPV